MCSWQKIMFKPGMAVILVGSLLPMVTMAQPALPTTPTGSGSQTVVSPSLSAPAPVTRPRVPRTAQSSIVIEEGSGRVITTGRPIANLFVADPKVAEARPASPNTVFVFGTGTGRTTVAALDESGVVIAQYDVVVNTSSYGASQASAALRRAVPDSVDQMTATPNGTIVDGHVRSAPDAFRAGTEARAYLADKQRVDTLGTVASTQQVTLKVRIAEISRQVTRQLGINWSLMANSGRFLISGVMSDGLSLVNNSVNTLSTTFTDANSTINNVLDILAQDQLVSMLAEPNLTARSGETASFLVGGEFPVTVSGQNNQISVQYKQYGVQLSFVPTVLTDGRISLKVHPEVSELSNVGAVSIPIATSLLGTSVITIPAITVRRAETTVELGSGQSFMLAGLLQDNDQQTARGLPYLGELPILGALFKSDQFVRNKTELVIVVTPYLVAPVSAPGRLRTPTDDYAQAGDFEAKFLQRQRAIGTGPEHVQRIVPLDQSVPASFAPLSPGTAPRVPANAGYLLP